MSTTLNKKDGVLTWLMLTGTPSARRCTKCIEGKYWEEMYDSYKVMSKALVQKPQEAQKAKNLVGHESSQGQEGTVL